MWYIDKYKHERYENEEGEVVEDRELVETLEFDDHSEAESYYRNNRISYGSGAAYYMLESIYEQKAV